ncbi:hypothetical protein VOA_000183 [Vibrio sp. RC586]|nr:hypothetical protein VOA_000183 [Vibrio sp. RC586]
MKMKASDMLAFLLRDMDMNVPKTLTVLVIGNHFSSVATLL